MSRGPSQIEVVIVVASPASSFRNGRCRLFPFFRTNGIASAVTAPRREGSLHRFPPEWLNPI